MRRLLWFWLLALLLGAVHAWAQPSGEQFSDELDCTQYDLLLTATPPAQPSPLHLLLEADAHGKSGIRVTITPRAITFEPVGLKGATKHEYPLDDAGAALHLTLSRCANRLVVNRDGTVIADVPLPHGGGAHGFISSGAWRVDAPRVQRLEPVVFADNFMRTADEPGQWTVQRGTWGLLSAWDRDPKGGYRRFATTDYAQNPFAWSGTADGSTESLPPYALCIAGQPFWEDYTLTAAVCPVAGGAAGVMVNMPDAGSGLLARWTPVNDASPTGNRLQLFRVADGARTLLVESAGGYLPGQWYQLTVTSGVDGVRVAIDGRERLYLKDATPWRGGIGLYAEGTAAMVFDDITAYGSGVKRDLLAEHLSVQLSARYQEDHKGMAEWAAAGNDWLPHPTLPGARLHRWDFFGDHWLSLTVTPTAGAGTLMLLLNNDGATADAGCRAVLAQGADGKLACTLYDGTRKLAAKSVERLAAQTAYGVRLRRDSRRVTLEIDGDPILTAETGPVAGLRLAYRADGAFATVSDAAAIGRNALDYTFADAPTDWMTEGTWMATTRWSCSPQWSFLGGWSRGDAVLWHKQRFTGDQSFEVYLAPKMEYPRERRTYEFHFRDLAVTICGDGHNPRSGYTVIYGLDASRTVLLRNGVEVSAVPGLYPSNAAGGHTMWYGIGLHKRGATVTVTLNRKPILTYTDPQPIDGGVPATWTTDNGVAVARARLAFANPPTPRDDPQVALDSPWCPEWAEIGRPVTLTFPGAVATSGKPVRLLATARDVPAGETDAAVTGATVTITPKLAGPHWYQVQASDGATTSPAYHAALQVFTPALGRDDSHAVVLYRFDEGSGQVIHDRSALAPAADLTIPAGSTTTWLPGQGLNLRGVNRIASAGGVGKLMALAQSRAATFEFWIGADTIFPPTDWLGYLLSWEKAGNPAQNLAVAQISAKTLLIPDGTIFTPRGNFLQDTMQTCALFNGYRTGLQHIVFTWDGRVTRCYLNGVKAGERTTAWKPEGWNPDAQLMLGNQLNIQPPDQARYVAYLLVAPYILKGQGTGQHAFLGTFYLAAVHDRCFSDADVARHYGAGPGAR